MKLVCTCGRGKLQDKNRLYLCQVREEEGQTVPCCARTRAVIHNLGHMNKTMGVEERE